MKKNARERASGGGAAYFLSPILSRLSHSLTKTNALAHEIPSVTQANQNPTNYRPIESAYEMKNWGIEK